MFPLLNINKTLFVGILLLVFAVSAFFVGHNAGSESEKNETNKWRIKYDMSAGAVQLLSAENQRYAQASANTITKDQFKEMFADELRMFSKDLKLKDIEHFTQVNTVTEHNIETTLKDSTVRDTTHVKAFEYITPNLQFKGYTTNDSLFAVYKHFLKLDIAVGKQPRETFWKKITLQPLVRNPIVQAMASDTNTVITHITSSKIK